MQSVSGAVKYKLGVSDVKEVAVLIRENATIAVEYSSVEGYVFLNNL